VTSQCTNTVTFQARQCFCLGQTHISGSEGAMHACPWARCASGASQRLQKCWGQLCVHSLSAQGQSFPPIGTAANLLAPAKPFFWRQCAITIPVSSAAVKTGAHDRYTVGFSDTGKYNKSHFCFDQLLSLGTN